MKSPRLLAATGPPIPGENPVLMWRILGWLFLAGGAIGLIARALPHPAVLDGSDLWLNVLCSLAAAAVCIGGARRLPAWGVHLALAAGTLLITRAVYLSAQPDSTYSGGFFAFFYIWVGIFAFFFFDIRRGLAHMVLVGAAFAWALVVGGYETPVLRWFVAMLTLAVAAFMVALLVERLRSLAKRYAALADERAGLLKQLEEVARTDDLTGLPNRRAWDEELGREVARAGRDRTPLCVAVIDLDRFKNYNDVHGHQAGDRMLKSVAAAWRRCLRATDILARYGGEEFTLALPGCDIEDATALLERLRESIAEDQACSAGLAEWSGREDAADLLGRADVALYQAKATGRGRIVVAS